jgi:competence protein CoiA
MQYAILSENRIIPSPGARASCPSCGAGVLAKCGKRVIWHWAHVSLRHCDSWWENETQWHREWKSLYPSDWREIVHFNDISGEKHIADVKTGNGVVLEFQNSPMTVDEMFSREDFYKNMIWIINGASFRKNFHILYRLPRPNADFVRDIVFLPQKHNHRGQLFYRKSECPDAPRCIEIHNVQDIRMEIDKEYVGHHVFDWVRPRSVWHEARMPVYIDFGENLLWRIDNQYQKNLNCVQAVSKDKFIVDTRNERWQ